MRVAENSRDLVAIEGGPDGGICVLFLKEILFSKQVLGYKSIPYSLLQA